jgi:moderate conductance mechanosensitive channel
MYTGCMDSSSTSTTTNTETLLESIFSEALFFLALIAIVVVSIRFINVIVDKYFAQIYKSSQAKGRNINKKRIKTLAGAIKSIISVAIWTVAVFVVMGHFGVNTAALLTGAGAVGIFFSIAGKDIIMDLYVGLMALAEDQYRVGDEVIVSKDHYGIVEEITLRTVRLRDPEGNVHIVPHSMARSIINKTYDYSTVSIDISFKNGIDLEKIKEIINDTGHQLYKDEHWGRSFVEPIKYIDMQNFDKSETTFTALGKVKPGKKNSVISEFKLRIYDAFEKDGIKLTVVEETNLAPKG